MSGIGVWSQFEHDPRVPANTTMRASDRDRAVIETVLADAFAEGRMTRTEYDERIDAALACRTLGELMPLVEDLPAGRTASPGETLSSSADARQARALDTYRAEMRHALWGFISASIICWTIWLATSGADSFPWPLFVMLGTGLNAGRVMFQKQEILTSEVRKQERKERKALEKRESTED